MEGKKRIVTWGGLFVLLCFAANVAAQGVVYVRPDGSGNGSSWGNATKSIKDALLKAQNDGADTVKVGRGEYLLAEELTIPAGVVLSGGWTGAGTRAEIPAKVTILRSNGSHRVATVFGEIEGVTATGGVVNGEDGGGLYVKSGGKVKNCIVTNNVAKVYEPKIGDLMLTDGTFYPVNSTPVPDEVKATARGIVIWLNPDQSVPKGQRGWICAMPKETPPRFSRMKWSTVDIGIQVTDGVYGTLEEALLDTAGWTHTQTLKDGPQFEAAKYCLDYSTLPDLSDQGKWYLPALGQLKFLYTEMSILNNTYHMLGGDPTYFLLLPGHSLTSTESGIVDREVWALYIKDAAGDLGGIDLLDNYRPATSYGVGSVIPVTSF